MKELAGIPQITKTLPFEMPAQTRLLFNCIEQQVLAGLRFLLVVLKCMSHHRRCANRRCLRHQIFLIQKNRLHHPIICIIMGNLIASLFGGLFNMEQEVRILILGLDNAGKTTILYRLQVGEAVTTIPTIGFNVETITYKNIKFQVWDLGGQTSIRPYWRCYYANTDAIIYVVDSSDRDRMGIAKEELFAMLDEKELKDSILLIMANKQDAKTAMSVEEVSEKLNLSKIKNRTWTIFKTSALNGTGINEGLEWLSENIKSRK